MNDRASDVAAYLVEHQADDIDPAELWIEIRQRWPDMSVEEGAESNLFGVEVWT